MTGPGSAFEVVIVGAGPVGLTLANLLGVHGIHTLVLERNGATVDEPRAIAIDAESLRTLQTAGLYDMIAPDLLLGFPVDYVNARGQTLFGFDRGPTTYGHPLRSSFDQPRLETQLLAGTRRFPHVEVRFGQQVEGFEQTTDFVTIAGRGEAAPFTVRAPYLVGCDGGRSTVRQTLGIAMHGRSAPQRWLVIDTSDPHLADTLDCRFFCDPARPAMTLRKQHGQRRWEFMLVDGDTDDHLLDNRTIAGLLAPHTQPEQVRIERKCIYTFHSLVADRYRDRRVLLAGDAAHMMPPFAGQGMNSGIRDSANLAWKLALLLRGRAAGSLLDTYELERREHVISLTATANELGAVIQPTNAWHARRRDLFFGLINLLPGAMALFRTFLLHRMTVPALRGGIVVAAARGRTAEYCVQPLVRSADGRTDRLDEFLGPGLAVVGYGIDPRQALPPASIATWAQRGGTLVYVVRAGETAGDGAVEDHTGALGAWLAPHSARLLIVRPDRFCAADMAPTDAAAVTAAFLALLGAGEGT